MYAIHSAIMLLVLKPFVSINAFYYLRRNINIKIYVCRCTEPTLENTFDEIKQNADSVCTFQ